MEPQATILVVDDNTENVKVVCNLLKHDNYGIAVAFDGESALRMVDHNKVDLILLDVMMPGIDGFETCLRLKQKRNLKDVPVIFLTAKGGSDDMVKGFVCGGVDYAVKPFRAQELLSRIQLHLEIYRQKVKLGVENNSLHEQVSLMDHVIENTHHQLDKTSRDLERANTRLRSINKAQSGFLNIVNHEVFGSIKSISGLVQILKYRIDSKRDSKMLDKIDDSLKVLEDFVNSAIRVSSIMSSHTKLVPQTVNVGKLIGYTLFMMNDEFKKKGISVRQTAMFDNQSVMGEHSLLVTAMVALFRLLIDRNRPNSVISIGRQEGECFSLIDSSPPIHIEEFETQSDFFSPTLNDQTQPFNSVVLAKSIVGLHNGQIKISHLNPVGNCVSVCFG